MDSKFTCIDSIKCYAPDLAFDNSGFHPDALTILSQLEEKSFWYVSRNNVIKKLFSFFIDNKRAKFLDMGCGNGTVLSALSSNRNLELFGSDVYLSGLKFAQKRLPQVKFFQIDAENIPFENEFDAIGCFDVLEHIENDTRVIAQINKALKHGGYLFISVPQHPWLWSKIDEIDRHKRRYTKEEIISKIRDAGFKIEYISSFAFSVFPIIIASRMFRKRKKKEKAAAFHNQAVYPEMRIPAFMNYFLRIIMKLDEWFFAKKIKLPFGGSIMLVAKK